LECSPALRGTLEAAVAAVNARHTAAPVPVLVSGAGHDGLAMSDLCPVSMLFVRCRGGVSHSPAEHVTPEDVGAAVEALTAVVRAHA
jgi:allantoate deiminase